MPLIGPRVIVVKTKNKTCQRFSAQRTINSNGDVRILCCSVNEETFLSFSLVRIGLSLSPERVTVNFLPSRGLFLPRRTSNQAECVPHERASILSSARKTHENRRALRRGSFVNAFIARCSTTRCHPRRYTPLNIATRRDTRRDLPPRERKFAVLS